MLKLSETWKNNSISQKLSTIAVLLLSLIVLIFAILGITGVIEIALANLICIHVFGLVCVINGIRMIKTSRISGIILFVTAGVIFIVTAINLFL